MSSPRGSTASSRRASSSACPTATGRGAAIELLGRCEEESGRTAEAVERYRLVIDTAPDRVSAYKRLADLYRRQNKPDEAA